MYIPHLQLFPGSFQASSNILFVILHLFTGDQKSRSRKVVFKLLSPTSASNYGYIEQMFTSCTFDFAALV